jgi:ATP-dependent Clp protease protease subunit
VLELRRLLDEIYAQHTGQSVEQVHDDMERDRFFSAVQAMEYGLVDRIVTTRELQRRPSGFALPSSSR